MSLKLVSAIISLLGNAFLDMVMVAFFSTKDLALVNWFNSINTNLLLVIAVISVAALVYSFLHFSGKMNLTVSVVSAILAAIWIGGWIYFAIAFKPGGYL